MFNKALKVRVEELENRVRELELTCATTTELYNTKMDCLGRYGIVNHKIEDAHNNLSIIMEHFKLEFVDIPAERIVHETE